MDTVAAFKAVRFNRELQIADLDGDSQFDAVVVNNDMRNPAVLAFLGQEDGRFAQEGRYPLEGGRGGPTLIGDLDRDGDRDLVVFDESHFESGGIHVLLNRIIEQPTSVEEIISTAPLKSHLIPAYPNPFNPGVVIPFTLGAPGGTTLLEVYNTLGQMVRQMELGVLSAGVHRVVWDGLDQQGQALSSGVYLYRLQAGAWGATGKIVKNK
jgi:hypothetical protein